ncbi:MAG: TIGR02646 family protein [Cyanobacteria bacterium MAG CAR4_bin_6]|nr:TIGR02646 family protein [Cyanobacteria bacterium MAG CAR4_bin_6]
MKRIRALDGPTPGLADYLEGDGNQANWDGFCSHQSGAAKRKLAEELCSIQHGLCGYCEINVTEQDRQVEHVIPQSDPEQGKARALDPTNMMVCCKGGTGRITGQEDERRRTPVRRNRSCGEAKGSLRDPQFIDPRDLPALPSLMQVGFDGKIRADTEACRGVSVDVDRVNRTIDILGLNVERLQLAREERWRALNDKYKEHFGNPQVMKGAARSELLPGEDGRLPRFFSTSRSYFGPVAEAILGEAPQAWI